MDLAGAMEFLAEGIGLLDLDGPPRPHQNRKVAVDSTGCPAQTLSRGTRVASSA